MDEREEVIPRLEDEQRRPLQLMFDVFVQRQEWPTYAYVDQELYRDDVDVDEVLASLPFGLFHPDRRRAGGAWFDEADKLSLTVRGLCCCHGSETVQERFVRGVEWGIDERKRLRVETPNEAPRPSWRFSEFVNAVALHDLESVPLWEAMMVLRLMEHESYLLRWNGGPNPPETLIAIPREIRKYTGIGSVEDYVRLAHPPAESDPRSVPNPFVQPTKPGDDVSYDGGGPPDSIDLLHPAVQLAAGALFRDGHFGSAILEAFKAVNIRVKTISGLRDDGQSLMGKALGTQGGTVRFNAGTTQSDVDEQSGLKLMFMGAMTGIRNPLAHDQDVSLDEREAYEHLALASLLMRRLDRAEELRGNR